MRVVSTKLAEVKLFEPKVFGDRRGFFKETWSQRRYAEAGVQGTFVQDNVSRSVRGTLRGLHLQYPVEQGKLLYVLEGEIFDVAVDARVGSPSYAQWVGVELSADNHRQVWVPPGFLHGFCVLSDSALVLYKCTAPYDPPSEVGVAFDDPDIGVRWPVEEPVLSDRDRAHPKLRDIDPARFPRFG